MYSMYLLVAVSVFGPMGDTPSYGDMTKKAIAEGKPLVVFVGVAKEQPCKGGDYLTVSVEKLEGYADGDIVVSRPYDYGSGKDGGKWLAYVKTLDKAANVEKEMTVKVHVSDALDQLNAQRAQRGLRPYIRDEGLMVAAKAAAEHRAARRIFGHTGNDFGFLPPGSNARAAGCAANEPSWGFMSCCAYENHTYAGAHAVMGSDGRYYCHLFVR